LVEGVQDLVLWSSKLVWRSRSLVELKTWLAKFEACLEEFRAWFYKFETWTEEITIWLKEFKN
jgi:hypothetical protein